MPGKVGARRGCACALPTRVTSKRSTAALRTGVEKVRSPRPQSSRTRSFGLRFKVGEWKWQDVGQRETENCGLAPPFHALTLRSDVRHTPRTESCEQVSGLERGFLPCRGLVCDKSVDGPPDGWIDPHAGGILSSLPAD